MFIYYGWKAVFFLDFSQVEIKEDIEIRDIEFDDEFMDSILGESDFLYRSQEFEHNFQSSLVGEIEN